MWILIAYRTSSFHDWSPHPVIRGRQVVVDLLHLWSRLTVFRELSLFGTMLVLAGSHQHLCVMELCLSEHGYGSVVYIFALALPRVSRM